MVEKLSGAGEPQASVEAGSTRARAWFLGNRIDTRQLERGEAIATRPLTVRAGENGYAFIFRFGVVVLWNLDAMEEARFIEDLSSFVDARFGEPENEAAEIAIDFEKGDIVDASGRVVLRDSSVQRLQVLAEVLAKSTVLAQYEERVARVFDRVEGLAENLGRGLRSVRGKELQRDMGSVLLIQAQTVGRVEVTEKPEITWDDPELDRLYERLALEYELRERDVALSRKLELISRAAETYLELLHNRRSIRLELYIVILIAVEIVLILYDIFARR